MRILDRYLLREFLASAGTSLLAFSLLFVTFDLFDRLGRFLNASAPPLSILLYYVHHLFVFNGNISLFVAILPISLLLAALFCASRLIRSNEFIAMMASGISLPRILAPYFAVGIVASGVALAAIELQAPRSTHWVQAYQRTVLKRGKGGDAATIANFLYLNTQDKRLWDIRRFSPTNTLFLGMVTVTQQRPDRSETIYVTTQAYWADGTWWLRSPRIEHRNPDGARVGNPEFYPRRAIEMRAWKETPHDFVIEHTAREDWQTLPARDLRTFLDNHPDFPKAKRARIETDYHSRFSVPFACLIVALLGVPAGLKTGRSNTMTRVLLSLGFFFLYYLSLQFSLYLGKTQILPPLAAAWLPNILFAAIGVRMIGNPH